MPSPPEGFWKAVAYEIRSDDYTGLRVLLHGFRFIAYDKGKETVIADGTIFAHFGKSVRPGETLLVSDSVYLDPSVVKRATELNSFTITERKTFHVVSDQGLYCEKSADLVLRMTPHS